MAPPFFEEMPMKRTRIVSAAIFLFLLATSITAQKHLLNQAYLNQFPTTDRVMAETKGTDPVDTHARYLAAITVINNFLIHDLLRERHGGYHLIPPAAQRVQQRYASEMSRLEIDSPEPPSRDPRFRPLRDKYIDDPAFTDFLLQKFFTPQFRADYYAWTGRPMPTTVVKASPTAVASVDPSIAKAKAAKVDISLFAGSIRFGDPLNLLACPFRTDVLGTPIRSANSPDCLDTMKPSGYVAETMDLINAIANTTPGPPDPDVHSIYLSPAHRPSWMSGETVSVRTSQGAIVRVVITTKGRSVETRAGQELIAKYGSGYFSNTGIITPDSGNEFKVRNLEWSLPGLHVYYQVLNPDENGRVTIDGVGFVRIETESAYQRRMAEEKKVPKSVL
jgi:hypothetical protein